MEKIICAYQEYGHTQYYTMVENKLIPVQEVTFTKVAPNAIILEETLYHLADDNTVTRICQCKEHQIHQIHDKIFGFMLLVKRKLYQVTPEGIKALPEKDYCLGESALMIQNRIYCGSKWYTPAILETVCENDYYTLVAAMKDNNKNIFVKYADKDYYHFVGAKCTIKGNLLIIPQTIGHDEAWLIGFTKLEKFGYANAIKVNETGNRIVFRFDRIVIGGPKPVNYEYKTYKLNARKEFELEGETSSWAQKF